MLEYRREYHPEFILFLSKVKLEPGAGAGPSHRLRPKYPGSAALKMRIGSRRTPIIRLRAESDPLVTNLLRYFHFGVFLTPRSSKNCNKNG